jgi:NADH-quinone oxidoreductase subunit B
VRVEPSVEQLSLDSGRTVALYNVSLVTVSLFNVGLACCAVEVAAAAARPPSNGPAIALQPYTAGPGEADVLVVSGTVTDAMAPAVRRLYERLAEPRFVVSYGACSNTGGPYWDSYAVTKGVDLIVPVDLYVPGCPPRPEALLEALRRLPERRPR